MSITKEVYILRGPSGSGKSSHAKQNFPHAAIVSADHFFLERREDNEVIYNFNPARLGEAHNACMTKLVELLAANTEQVVVDNTNIHTWEYGVYVAVAKAMGYDVFIHELVPNTIEDMRTCIERNKHNVPAEVICRMCLEFEEETSDEFEITTMSII